MVIATSTYKGLGSQFMLTLWFDFVYCFRKIIVRLL